MECIICSDPFAVEEAKPVLLACSHTICDSCVLVLKQHNTIVCPVCRENNAIQEPFPLNTVITAILQLQQQTAPKPQHCENCDSKSATVFCHICRCCLCDSCFDTTQVTSTFEKDPPQHARHHQRLFSFACLQVMQGHTKSPIALKQFVLCEAHNNELKHYCVDCSKPLCFECLASECRSHNTHELTAVASQNKQSLRSATQELQAQHEAINERLKQIHERISGKQPQQLELAPPKYRNHCQSQSLSQSQPNSHINQQKPCHPRRKHARLL